MVWPNLRSKLLYCYNEEKQPTLFFGKFPFFYENLAKNATSRVK